MSREIERAVDELLGEQDFDQVDYGTPEESATQEAIARGVPPHVAPALVRYIQDHVPTGGFLRAVLENDLFKAFAKADLASRAGMEAILSYIYNEAPAPCWGSKKAVKQWLA